MEITMNDKLPVGEKSGEDSALNVAAQEKAICALWKAGGNDFDHWSQLCGVPVSVLREWLSVDPDFGKKFDSVIVGRERCWRLSRVSADEAAINAIIQTQMHDHGAMAAVHYLRSRGLLKDHKPKARPKRTRKTK
jgi:hypothetical protein